MMGSESPSPIPQQTPGQLQAGRGNLGEAQQAAVEVLGLGEVGDGDADVIEGLEEAHGESPVGAIGNNRPRFCQRAPRAYADAAPSDSQSRTRPPPLPAPRAEAIIRR